MKEKKKEKNRYKSSGKRDAMIVDFRFRKKKSKVEEKAKEKPKKVKIFD